MKKRAIQFVPLVIALLGIGFGDFSQWCTQSGNVCYRTILDQMIPTVTYPLYFFALYFLPLAIVLIFVSRAVFKSWLKLAVWLLPLAFISVALTNTTSSQGLGMDLFPYTRDDAARQMAEIVIVISFLLIAWKYFKAHRADTRASKNTA
ncbi:MAG TPA: hypothetical protein ENJ75_00955 [Candidatus Kaiserbacteria bacterium]|nr:hypothetical protein [Candidatus Kaiserbacteria bacterium]